MQGKVAIVTGAAGGIGEACVRALGAKGVKVLGTGRSADKLRALKEELAGSVEFDFVAVDVTADDAPEKIVNGAIEADSARLAGTDDGSITAKTLVNLKKMAEG